MVVILLCVHVIAGGVVFTVFMWRECSEPAQRQDESPFLTVWIVLLIVFQLLINRGQINVKTE